MICLSGVSSDDLENVLNYVYNGEVQIYQDDLDRFLEVAQRLKLDGLLATEENQDQDLEDRKNVIVEDHNKLNEPESPRVLDIIKAKPEKITTSIERMVSISSADMNDINKEINEHIIKDGDKIFRCSLCGKTAKQKIHIQHHVETHMDGLEFPCQLCDKTFR